MPANLITLAHFSVSSARSLPNSAGEPVMGERIVTYILKAIHSPTNAPTPLSSKDE
jgi:hypothetical protein